MGAPKRPTGELQAQVLALLFQAPMTKHEMRVSLGRKTKGTDQLLESALRVLVQEKQIGYGPVDDSAEKKWRVLSAS